MARAGLTFADSAWNLTVKDTLSEERGGDHPTEFDLVYTAGDVTFRFDDIFDRAWTEPTEIVRHLPLNTPSGP